MLRRIYISLMLVTLAVAAFAQSPRPGPQQPARDTPAQQRDTPPPPGGRISGRVISDTGRPVKRARAFITAAELPGGRGSLTDENGIFDFTELPAGRYTLTVSKSGFVSLSYGQRRPLQAGTPLQLADGQQLKGIEFRLPRGGVVAGHVFDEDGEPMPGAIVRVMRYQYLQGDKRLTPAGTAQTDDKGQYRVWGLMPGDYYINAVTRIADFGRGGGPGGRGGPAGAIAGFIGGALGGNIAAVFGGAGDDQDRLAYAPTYFPGVGSVNEARPIAVGLSQEVLDVDFNLQLVRTSRVSGHVANPDGTPTTSGNVNLTAEGASGGGRGQIGINYSGRIEWDGNFSIGNVPPGRYVLRARGDDTELPQYAMQPLSVTGGEIADLPVTLMPGASLSGSVTFLPGQSPVPGDLTQVRITAPAVDESGLGPNPNVRVDKEGRFTLDGVPAGAHLIRPNGGLRGWALKSVTVEGREVTDTPIDLKSGQKLANVSVVFTDKLSEVNGTVADQQGTPITEFTVLAFPTDPSLWRPQSRHIMTARPDQTGKFRIRGLPPAEYYLVTVDPTEQGEWFEPAFLDQHRAAASRLTIAEGDVKTQDFKVTMR
jgi:Carboxypeptidase regulatory-like domain